MSYTSVPVTVDPEQVPLNVVPSKVQPSGSRRQVRVSHGLVSERSATQSPDILPIRELRRGRDWIFYPQIPLYVLAWTPDRSGQLLTLPFNPGNTQVLQPSPIPSPTYPFPIVPPSVASRVVTRVLPTEGRRPGRLARARPRAQGPAGSTSSSPGIPSCPGGP